MTPTTPASVARALERAGFTVRHRSTRGGRIASIYALPAGADRREIRVSDHALPDRPEAGLSGDPAATGRQWRDLDLLVRPDATPADHVEAVRRHLAGGCATARRSRAGRCGAGPVWARAHRSEARRARRPGRKSGSHWD